VYIWPILKPEHVNRPTDFHFTHFVSFICSLVQLTVDATHGSHRAPFWLSTFPALAAHAASIDSFRLNIFISVSHRAQGLHFLMVTVIGSISYSIDPIDLTGPNQGQSWYEGSGEAFIHQPMTTRY
jgi:hypothetical protein